MSCGINDSSQPEETLHVSLDDAHSIVDAQMTDEEVFQTPLVQALMKSVSIPVLKSPFTLSVPMEIKAEKERIVAGYASVEIVDRQHEMIPLEVLRKAWNNFIKNEDYMHVQLMHTNIPVGKILLEHPKIDKKSGVDKNGLFIIVKIRNDIKKADETWFMIRKGQYKYFSIGGEALHRSIHCEGRCFTRVDSMELHEVSIVPNPANQASEFTIIKGMGEIVKLNDVLSALPEGMIIIKDFINLCGSVSERGEKTLLGKEGEDRFDLQVKHPLDKNSFLKRAVITRFQKQFPNLSVGRGGDIDLFFGDVQGPHDTYYPVYDLVLLKRHPLEKVDMTLRKPCPPRRPEEEEVAKSILKQLKEMQLALEIVKTQQNLKVLIRDNIDKFVPIEKAQMTVEVNVKQRDGKTPAPFASVTAYQVVRVLFWEFDKWVASTTADFKGNARLSVPKGKIHLKFSWHGHSGDLWRDVKNSPFRVNAIFP